MVLPEGFALPPLPYLLALAVADGAAVAWLLRARPQVTQTVVLGFAPWMLLGAALHAAFIAGVAPGVIAPLLGTPAVYMSVLALAVGAWWATRRATGNRSVGRTLGAIGAGTTLAVVTGYLVALPAIAADALPWAAVTVGVTAGLTVAAWVPLRSRVDLRGMTAVGPLVIASHALDGVSTAVGVSVFGFGERTPAAAFLLEIGRTLPVADLLGPGWLFVLVKLGVASAVVWLFADFVRETPRQGYLLSGVVAAVGLGPGTFNLLLMFAA